MNFFVWSCILFNCHWLWPIIGDLVCLVLKELTIYSRDGVILVVYSKVLLYTFLKNLKKLTGVWLTIWF